jgi:hypothetical protein
MLIIFPSSSDSQSLPDSKFLKESLACEELGIDFTTVDLRALMAGRGSAAFDKTATRNGELGIYRGGTLRPREYAELNAALAARGIQLLTSPEQFARTQLFASFYPLIADFTLPAVTTTSLEPGEVRAIAMQQLGPPPYFIKDYVKSAKEIWPRGCVIDSPGSVAQFAKTISELLEYRGDRFESGLVIRPLVKLHSLGLDPFGDECFEEYRMIYLRGKRVFAHAYGYYSGTFTDFARFDKLAERIDSPFFMADCVITERGECFLLETGDGGCCGLPPGLDCRDFYRALQHQTASVEAADKCGFATQ